MLDYYDIEYFVDIGGFFLFFVVIDQLLFYDGFDISLGNLIFILGGISLFDGNFIIVNFGVCFEVVVFSGCLIIQFVFDGIFIFQGFQGSWECLIMVCEVFFMFIVENNVEIFELENVFIFGQL